VAPKASIANMKEEDEKEEEEEEEELERRRPTKKTAVTTASNKNVVKPTESEQPKQTSTTSTTVPVKPHQLTALEYCKSIADLASLKVEGLETIHPAQLIETQQQLLKILGVITTAQQQSHSQ